MDKEIFNKILNVPSAESYLNKTYEINIPQIPQISPIPPIPTDANLASEFYDRLIEMINEFDEELDHEHEVGIRLVSFGQTVTFHVTDLGYYNPSLITFHGLLDNGSKVELIQHVSQISFLLMAMKRLDPTKPKKPIGFRPDEEDESAASSDEE